MSLAIHAPIVYEPRTQQAEVHDLVEGHRFGTVVAHRRWGKSVCFANELIKRAITTDKSDFRAAYISPTYSMSKSVIWDELRRYTAHMPQGLFKFNDSELRVDFINGSRLRLFGAENPDRLRGQYYDCIVLDEADFCKIETFTEVLRPAISDRKGSFYAIGTFKYTNGTLGQLYDMADQENWFRRVYSADTSGALDKVELADAAKVMSKEEYAREYLCVRVAAVRGSILGRLVDEAESDGRITSVPHDPSIPVTTSWDLGIGDSTSILFVQQVGRGEVRIIDHYETSGESLAHYAQVLKDKGYTYNDHIAPHDIGIRELGTGRSRLEVARELGINFRVLPRVSQNQRSEIEERIEASRMLMPRCWFNAETTKQAVESLRSWRREENPATGEMKERPVHDVHSHTADAFGYLAMGIREVGKVKRPKVNTSWVY